MQDDDILKILPKLYNIPDEEIKKAINKGKKEGQKGLSRYQIVDMCMLGCSKRIYGKLNEFIVMGFLVQVNNNPPEFQIDKEKIWEFCKETDIGKNWVEMVEDQDDSII